MGKLTKSKIVTWLHSKKADQLAKFREETERLLREEALKILEEGGLSAFYDKWQPQFNEAFRELDNLMEELREAETLGNTCYSLSLDNLRRLTGEDRMRKSDLSKLYFTKESYEKLEEERSDDYRVIASEWSKLISSVRSLTSVKKIKEFLAELSIDIQELEEQVAGEKPMLPSTNIRTDLLSL